MKRNALALLPVLFAAVPAVAGAAPFRVALVLGPPHGEEFSSVPPAFEGAGWTFSTFRVADDRPAEAVKADLLAALERTDLVAVGPLAPDVFAGEGAAWRAFLERGGAVAVTDCNYPDKYAWTDQLGPDYRHPDGEGFAGWSPADLKKEDPEPAIRTFPAAQVDGGMLWYHFNLANAGAAWRPVVRCARHGQPCAIRADVGRGFVYLTNLRCPYSSFFENLRAATELRRAGLEVVSASGLALTNGAVAVEVRLRAEGGAPAPNPQRYLAALEIASATNAAQAVRAEAPLVTLPGGAIGFRLRAANAVRGPGRVRLVLRDRRDGSEISLVDRNQAFDDLVEIETPHHWATVSTKRRAADVSFAFRLNPAGEKVVPGTWRAWAKGPDGRVVASTPREERLAGWRTAFRLPVPADAPAGDYTVGVEVVSAQGGGRWTKTAPFRIVAPTPTQVLPDQDGVLLRGGAPWFPLGMYHADPPFWQEVRDTGFNLQQAMNWLDGDFPRLAAMGQPLLYETKHNSPENMAIWAKRYANEPFACMMYVTDEPDDTLVWKWEACRRAVHEADPDHPTFAVLAHPASFRYQRNIADLLAIDLYPIGRDGSGDMVEIERRIRACRAACGDERPVLAVLQSFGWEPQEKFRAMAYLSIVSGARGILWYCWQEGDPPNGLHTNPALQEFARGLLAEIRGLAPSFLSGRTKELSLCGGRVRALLCGTKETGVHLICVNPTDEAAVVNDAPKMPGVPDSFALPPAGVAVY